MKNLLLKLYETNSLTKDELLYLLTNIDKEYEKELFRLSDLTRRKYYSNKVYFRGLIEFSNHCKNTCKYCGLRSQNKNVERYRLNTQEILDCCDNGYKMGLRTFVLQSGEDGYFTEDILEDIAKRIKDKFPDVALTCSIGEKSKACYEKMFNAGADRFLLRHESANKNLYEGLHPNMSFENRLKCLKNLKSIGYQAGSGFIVGLPNQTDEIIAEDLLLLKNLDLQMVGVGPFVPQSDTPLYDCESGSSNKTLICLAIVRLLLPKTLIPATTALAVVSKDGWINGVKIAANVIMLNLSPPSAKDKYRIYDGKNLLLDSAKESLSSTISKLNREGFVADMSKGNYPDWERNDNYEYNA